MQKTVKNVTLTYEVYKRYVNELKAVYPQMKVASCGKSVLGKKIYSFVIGEGKETVVYVGGTHGLEWLTSLVLLRFCENIMYQSENDGQLSGYNVRKLLNNRRLIIIPEINPDGIEIAVKGACACEEYKMIDSRICNGDFSGWSANARGVDINHNFNADWYALRDYEKERGIDSPSPRRFGGAFPESEPETKAITRLCRNIMPDMLFTFHSQGEEIYYEYGNNTPEKSYTIAKVLGGLTDYALVKNEGHAASGGLKDWFIEEFRRPAFTVEIGKGKNPLPLSDFDDIYFKTEPLMVLGLVL
ncbi:MAG: M14 family metallocarboxypeptidase [Clostridia bacterium]|nr:M14 family metallocarboxypeptidase [Clostridia bacterium]